MGNCKYCGKSAGFLSKAHKECEKKFNDGTNEIIMSIGKDCISGNDLNILENKIKEMASNSYISDNLIKNLIISGWENAVKRAFDDGILTEEEEKNIINMMDHFLLNRNVLDNNGAYTKVVKGAVLRDILNGKIPDRVRVDGELPFNFQKKEKLVWLFQKVDYYEQKVRHRYEGGMQGVSIRLAKGLYYRTGAFKGRRVETTETIHSDIGLFGVTDKHIYFAGSNKKFRVNYCKIVCFDPYSDGIGIQRDASTAKPQLFITGDGWFTYNLIMNLAQL